MLFIQVRLREAASEIEVVSLPTALMRGEKQAADTKNLGFSSKPNIVDAGLCGTFN